MATVSFLWHLHQPCYRTADGVAHAPWAAVHAGGSYATLARAIADTGARGQVLNLVPTLVEQVEAYRDDRVHDPVITALTRRTSELDAGQRRRLLEWGFHVPGRQVARYERLRELAGRRSGAATPERLAARFGTGDLRDLQVLFVLAQAGEQAWRDPRLAPLAAKGRHFSPEEHAHVSAWLGDQPGELLRLWRSLADQPGVEIATSPFAHPIMPLLIDTAIVRDSWAPHPAPQVPTFRHPEDARRQLDAGLAFMRERGFAPGGCWPPEGSVSAEAVAVYAEAGVRWLVTDEGILERSLGRPLRPGGEVAGELYRPWRLDGPCPALFFRDRWLSDRIGFVYGHWEDEARAADDMVRHLEGLAHRLPPEASIVVALDGENAWLHYPHAGGTFLRTLFTRLNAAGPHLKPVTLAEATGRARPARLPRLHPGSWIGSVFATWIGHPEKSRGWAVLAEVRDAVAAQGGPEPPSLLVAEASDWFWWLGDDNPTELAPLYDQIFRRHLRDVCDQAGIEAPEALDEPLKSPAMAVQVPVSENWPAPTLDGRLTSYFEWSLARWVDAGGDGPLRRLALWARRDELYLLLDGDRPLHELVNGQRLRVRLQKGAEETVEAVVTADGCDNPAVRCALGRVAELALPWRAGSGWRLEVWLGAQRLPGEAVLVLEARPVDEDLTAGNGG